MKEVSKSYCRVPFDSITVTPTGRMQMCCEAQWTALLSTEKTSIKDLDSIDNWFNSDYLNNVRKSMLEGKLLPECVTCYKNEKLYDRSVRTAINKEYFAKNNNTTEYSIKKVDFKLGNKCNLKCKMCFPYASSELWKEWKALGWNSKEKDPNKDTSWKYYDGYFKEDYAWPKNKTNMDKIKEVAVKSKLIHVTGGEPTLNPEFFDLLRHCIDTGVAKNIMLDVTTNATKIHPKFFDMVRQFKKLDLIISMDGIDKTYEYVRYPAVYNTVYKNILKYTAFVKTLNKDSTLRFNFVLQMWNIHSTIDVIKTLTPLAVNETQVPVMIEVLNDPRFMHWDILPEWYIKKIVANIHKEKQANHPELIRYGIFAFAEKLTAYKERDVTELKKQLLEFTTIQDKHRKINLKDYIPNLEYFFR